MSLSAGNHAELVVDRVAVADTLVRLRSGETFVELIEDRVDVRAADLAAVIDQFADSATKLVWTGNPLRAPLTIERLVLQAAGPDADLRVERTPEELAHMLIRSADQEARRLLIVQQPETLDPVARETLAQMAPHLAAGTPPVQILFCGTHAFQRIATSRRSNLPACIEIDAPPPPPPPLQDASSVTRRDALPLLVLLVLAAAGAALSSQPRPVTKAAMPTRAEAAPSPAAVAEATPAPSSTPVADPPPAASDAPGQTNVDIAALRREFDQFLARQPDRVSALTPDQRNILFEEYLRRARKAADQPL